MDKQELEDYLKRLQKLDESLKTDNFDEFDLNFASELENILNTLNTGMQQEIVNNQPQYEEQQTVGLVVKVKKLHDNAVIPSYSKIGDAGMDLTSVDIEETEDYISYKTGLAMEIPKGYVGLLFPRSSNSKKDLLLTNSVGVIDSGYRGEIELRYKRIKSDFADTVKKYEVGDRVGQIMIIPYPQVFMTPVPELSDSDRGQGGFGSTGK